MQTFFLSARGAVEEIVGKNLRYFLEQNPQVAKSICEKAVLAQLYIGICHNDDFVVTKLGNIKIFTDSGSKRRNHWDTTMDPAKRILLRVSMDEESTSELDVTFTTLMGDNVEQYVHIYDEACQDRYSVQS